MRKILTIINLNNGLTVKILNTFIFIYEKFIRCDFAPFEVNINSDGLAGWYHILMNIKTMIRNYNSNTNKNQVYRDHSRMLNLNHVDQVGYIILVGQSGI